MRQFLENEAIHLAVGGLEPPLLQGPAYPVEARDVDLRDDGLGRPPLPELVRAFLGHGADKAVTTQASPITQVRPACPPILTRARGRGEVFAAKTLATATYTLTLVFAMGLAGLAAGTLAWGFHPLTSLSGTKVAPGHGLVLLLASLAIYALPLAGIAALRACGSSAAGRPWSARTGG